MPHTMNALLSIENVKDGTRCTFLLPKLYTIPPHLSTANPQECAVAFQIADQVLASKEKYCLEEYSSRITQNIEQQYEDKVEKLVGDHKKDIQRLDTESRAIIHRLEHTLLEKETYFKKQIADLEIELRRATASQEVIHAQYLEEAERRVEQQKESDSKLIDHLKADIERFRAEIKELETKLQSRLSIQHNSSKRGHEGEETFQQILKDRKGWNLIYSGDKGHSADYYTTLYNIQIRFEVKDYSHVVPTKEVEKLRRDMREHPETDVGVFVSLNTGITSIPSINLEWTPTNQLILFIPLFLQLDVDIVLHFLDLVFQTVKPYRAILTDASHKEQYPILKERIERSLIYARNGMARIAQSISQFTLDMRALQDKIEDMTSHMKTNMAAQKEELQSMIAILSGQDVLPDKEEGEEKPDSLPLVHEKKRTTKGKKKDTFAILAIT